MVSLPTMLIVAALAAPPQVEVVKFTASWCAPCQAMEPVLEQVARQGYSVRRIDVDQRPDLAAQHQIKSVPTMLIVADGQVVDRIEGAIPIESLLTRLDRFTGTSSVGPTRASAVQRARTIETPEPAEATVPPRAAPSASPITGNHSVPIEQQARQATVRLRIEDQTGHSFGTGTIVDVHGQDALVLTCGHIFRDSHGKGRIIVDLFSPGAESSVTGELIRYDLEQDLALVGIRSSGPLPSVPVAGPNWRAAAGQPLFSVGCDHGQAPRVM